MGERGPTRKPHGPRHNRRQAAGAVASAPVSRPVVPAHFKPEHVLVWDRLCDTLESLSLLSAVDWSALERYCVLLVRWHAAEEFLAKMGSTYNLKTVNPNVPYIGVVESNREGQRFVEYITAVVSYPQVRIASDLAKLLVQLESRFGLSPSARSGLLGANSASTPSVRSRIRR